MKVSVVVPVYNAGDRLAPCLESLRTQTLCDMEILLVLDCPTDGSDQIAKRFALDDVRFRVVENDHNMHIGYSRNRGLELAQGEFVAFVDHDDICMPAMLEHLYQQAYTRKADVVYSLVRTTQTHDATRFDTFPQPMADAREYAMTDILSRGGKHHADSLFNPVLGAIYRRETFASLRFEDTRVVSAEDKLWNIQCLMLTDKIVWLNEELYLHENHASNAGGSRAYMGYVCRGKTMEHLFDMMPSWPESWQQAFVQGMDKEARRLMVGALLTSWQDATLTRHYLQSAQWVQYMLTHLERKHGLMRRVLYRLMQRS